MHVSCHGSQWPKVCELAQFTMAESRRVSATQEFVEDFVEMKSYVLFPTTSQIFQMCQECDAVAASHEITVCQQVEVQSPPCMFQKQCATATEVRSLLCMITKVPKVMRVLMMQKYSLCPPGFTPDDLY
jgi:hypothetical protein